MRSPSSKRSTPRSSVSSSATRVSRHVLRRATLAGVSTDSHFSHLAWATQPRKQGGLGPDLKLPLIADKNQKISRDYNVLIEEEGIALRGLFLIDPKGTLRYAPSPCRIKMTR